MNAFSVDHTRTNKLHLVRNHQWKSNFHLLAQKEKYCSLYRTRFQPCRTSTVLPNIALIILCFSAIPLQGRFGNTSMHPKTCKLVLQEEKTTAASIYCGWYQITKNERRKPSEKLKCVIHCFWVQKCIRKQQCQICVPLYTINSIIIYT